MRSESGTGQREDPALHIHSARIQDVYTLCETQQSGLSEEQAVENLTRFGKNTLVKTKKKSPVIRFLSNFTHLMAILLWIGGIIALFAQMIQLGIAIWMVNLINGIFSFWQEFRAEKAAEALMNLLPRQVRVVRDGQIKEIPAEDLVPGDIIALSEGDHISADARLVEEAALRIDQSNPYRRVTPGKKDM